MINKIFKSGKGIMQFLKPKTYQDKIFYLISECLGTDTQIFDRDINLCDDLGFDELDLISLQLGMEEDFKVDMDDIDIECKTYTVGCILDMASKYLSKRFKTIA